MDEVVLYVDGGPRRNAVGSVLIMVGVVDGSSLSISTSRNGRGELLTMELRDLLHTPLYGCILFNPLCHLFCETRAAALGRSWV